MFLKLRSECILVHGDNCSLRISLKRCIYKFLHFYTLMLTLDVLSVRRDKSTYVQCTNLHRNEMLLFRLTSKLTEFFIKDSSERILWKREFTS